MNSSMNIHRVESIKAMVQPLECYGEVSSTTKLIVTAEDGSKFTLTCFSDQPVTVEEVIVEPVTLATVDEEAVPA